MTTPLNDQPLADAAHIDAAQSDAAPPHLATRVDHAVVGATDIAATTAFLVGLGFVVIDQRPLLETAARALYGADGAIGQVCLGVPGSTAGGLRVVGPVEPAPDRAADPYRRGGHAIDLYTTDIDASIALSRALGAHVGPLADYTFGPVHLRQAMATGPDGLDVVFVEIGHRLPSVLDRSPDRLHSELHSVVWAVDDLDAATTWWTDVAGLELRSRFPIAEPAVAAFMGLPRATALAMSVFTGPAAAAPRFELLAYDGEPGGHLSALPLLAGTTLPVLRADADALDPLLERLIAHGAEVGERVQAPAPDGPDETAVHVAARIGATDVQHLEIRSAVSP